MRKGILKKLLKIVIIFGVYLSLIYSVIAYSEPTIEVDPLEPEQLSSMIFKVTFDDYNDVNEVFLLYNECTKNDICFTRENKSLINMGNGVYELTINLEHDNSAYIQYWIEFNTNEGWKAFPEEAPYPKTYLKEKQTSNGSNNNGQNNDDTPGFELIGIIISMIFILLFVHIRKR
jgi:hypothetical protein